MITAEDVLDALAVVRDPELDEPVTDLGFVQAVTVDRGRVEVALRLPTYFCAPNFAYLMAADARSAVAALAGVDEVGVRLVDHHADAEITDGLATGADFEGTFEGLTAGSSLEELRATFNRKAYLSRTHEVCVALMDAGYGAADLAGLRLSSLPDTEAARRFLDRRRDLGIPSHPDALLLLDVWGDPVPPEDVEAHLRRARTVHVSIEGNAGFCRGLLETRYGEAAAASP